MEIIYGKGEIAGIEFQKAEIKASYGTLDKAGRVMGGYFRIRPAYDAVRRLDLDFNWTMELRSFPENLWRVETLSTRDGKHFGPCVRRPAMVKGTLADAIAYVEKTVAKKARAAK